MKIWEIDRSQANKKYLLERVGIIFTIDEIGNMVSGKEERDITESYSINNILNFDFTEIIDFSEDEKIILRNIDKRFKYIARQTNGDLWAYENKPNKRGVDIQVSYWAADRGWSGICAMFNHLFPRIQWENTEPTLIADITE